MEGGRERESERKMKGEREGEKKREKTHLKKTSHVFLDLSLGYINS
jgi:hypothetical protein